MTVLEPMTVLWLAECIYRRNHSILYLTQFSSSLVRADSSRRLRASALTKLAMGKRHTSSSVHIFSRFGLAKVWIRKIGIACFELLDEHWIRLSKNENSISYIHLGISLHLRDITNISYSSSWSFLQAPEW